jgi:hypothetical protein
MSLGKGMNSKPSNNGKNDKDNGKNFFGAEFTVGGKNEDGSMIENF